MFAVLLPLGIVIVATTTYQVAQKTLPSGLNPFAVLVVAYALATLLCSVLAALTSHASLLQDLRGSLSAAVGLLVISFVGIEVGYLLVYRAGGAISTVYAIASTGAVLGLFAIGALIYKEPLSVRGIVGLALALIGGWLLMTRRYV